MNFPLTTNRKFGTIESCQYDNNQIRQTLQRHGLNVVKLILRECHVVNVDEFVEYLNFTPNLEHIVIEMLTLNDGSDVLLDHALPDLKKLKHLEMGYNDQRIIKCFRKAKLRTIKVYGSMNWAQQSSLMNFLTSQEMLTSITDHTRGSVGSVLTEMWKPNVRIPFRLTHLAFSRDDYDRVFHLDDDKNLLRFVESQARHLRELELGVGIPDEVYELAFCSMIKLNSLTLEIGELPRDDEFYDRLKENCSVRTMELLGSPFYIEYLGEVFKKLPNIDSLILSPTLWNVESILSKAKYLEKLESLSVGSIYKGSLHFNTFLQLKTLHIEHLVGKINWNIFTMAHSLLTELRIKKMGEGTLTSDDIDQITNHVDLHSIRFGFGFDADDRFFEIIRAKCTNLKVLKLHKSCISRGQNCNVDINVLFRLFDNI